MWYNFIENMEKDYRQVVVDVRITSSKLYNDFVYGWVVLHSVEEDGIRFILKKDFVFVQVADELGINRKTLTKYFSYLIEVGLITEELDKWVLNDLGDMGFWIESDVLRRIVELKKRYALTIYVYLVKGYWVSNNKKMVVLLKNVKGVIGIGINTDSNNYLITDCFELFREMGLLNCQLWYDKESGKRFYCLDGVGRNNYF